MELLREFSAINKHDAAIAGGKGASLGEMTQAGIPVPPGFVLLSAAFERFIEETDLNVEIDAILHKVDHKEIHTVDRASEEIQGLILAAEMPKDIGEEIRKNFKALGSRFVAVRSSATAEDSASAAWAGQLDSFLNTTEKTLLENVKRCWASLFTPRAIFYRFELLDKESRRRTNAEQTRNHAEMERISVAVVIQKMVESEISGIAFSVHPVTEDRNQLIIEGGFGLGEAIVSGQITPDSYVVEKTPRKIIDVNVSAQERGLFKKTGGGNEWRDISVLEGEKQKLSEAQILELSELIIHIENHYGFPCDIEWAFEGGKFYVVQSRPITTLKKVDSVSVKSTAVSTGKMEDFWVNNFSADECSYQLTSAMLEFGLEEGEKAFFGKKHLSMLTQCFLNFQGNKLEGGYLLDKDLRNFANAINKFIYENPEKVLKNHTKAYALNDAYILLSRKIILVLSKS